MCVDTVVALLVLLSTLTTPVTCQATHPQEHCDAKDRMVSLLTGYPHFETWQLALQDEKPDQGHSIDYFENKGESGKHSYTLIRTKSGEQETCILSAGIVAANYLTQTGCHTLKLVDETDPDVYYLSTCGEKYSIIRATLSAKLDQYGSPKNPNHGFPFVASYRYILSDFRKGEIRKGIRRVED